MAIDIDDWRAAGSTRGVCRCLDVECVEIRISVNIYIRDIGITERCVSRVHYRPFPYAGAGLSIRAIIPDSTASFSPESPPGILTATPTLARWGERGISWNVINFRRVLSNFKTAKS